MATGARGGNSEVIFLELLGKAAQISRFGERHVGAAKTEGNYETTGEPRGAYPAVAGWKRLARNKPGLAIARSGVRPAFNPR